MMQPDRHDRNVEPSFDVICCSLERWDEVWRRSQFLAAELLRLQPELRLLFVEQAVDIPWSLAHRGWAPLARLRPIGETGRCWAVRPRKWLPRRMWAGVDRSLGHQVVAAASSLGLRDPLLWINDSTYATLVEETGWRTVYDVTDDWLLETYRPAELSRQRRNDQWLVERANDVVVCSPNLAESRGQDRSVHLIPNGVDVDHLRRLQARPKDLPSGPVALYAGTLAETRLDVDLCIGTARELRDRATLVFVGPNSLSAQSTRELQHAGALLLGARSYQVLPGYLQHADVVVVPHRVTPFTESLDPIKARELVAVGRPTVSTPVAGFRDLGPPVTVVPAERFAAELSAQLGRNFLPPGPGPLVSTPSSWSDRAADFLAVLEKVASVEGAPLKTAARLAGSGRSSWAPIRRAPR